MKRREFFKGIFAAVAAVVMAPLAALLEPERDPYFRPPGMRSYSLGRDGFHHPILVDLPVRDLRFSPGIWTSYQISIGLSPTPKAIEQEIKIHEYSRRDDD